MTLRESIKISIIIPAYNRESYIGECLDGVLRQTILEKEIICIDDGSDDATWRVMTDYASRYENITVLKQGHAGVSAARNYGIREAKGEYIAFMDSDDWYPKDDVLEYMYNKAKEYNVVIAGGGVNTFDSTNPTARYAERVHNPKEEKVISVYEKSCIGSFWQYIYQRKFLIQSQIYFPHSTVWEDTYFICMAQLKAGKILLLPKSVYVYRVAYRDTPITRLQMEETEKIFSEIMEVAKNHQLRYMQKGLFERLEIIPFYQYVALQKGIFLEGLEHFWRMSLFDRETTERMILSKKDIDDFMSNGNRYEETLISDIRRFHSCAVYGYTGGMTKFLLSYLKDNFNIEAQYIVVSKGFLSQKNLGNIPMLEIDDLVGKVDPDEIIFLVATHLASQDVIQENVKRLGFRHIRLIDFRKLQLLPHALGMKFCWS